MYRAQRLKSVLSNHPLCLQGRLLAQLYVRLSPGHLDGVNTGGIEMKLLHSFQTLWKRNRGLSTTLLLGSLSCTLIGVTQLPKGTSGNAATVASVWSKTFAQERDRISQRTPASFQIERNDFFVTSDPEIQIAVREVLSRI